jgi:alkanesulfonate monooxygenase SsuD/methylene tetrahydromethanopterin reductase-like flavin-dependent oxidoreductase (luciferase family)
MDGYWERVAKAGKDESPYRGGFAQVICVADTDAEAEKLYAEHVHYFYNRCLHVYPGFADAPGYRTVKTLQANMITQLTQAQLRNYPTLTWKDLVDQGYVIAGSPKTVYDRMVDLAKTLRVGNIFGLFQIGDMPGDKVRHSTKLFAEQVMPKLKAELFQEWKNEDRFWIKPMQQSERRQVAAE